MLTLQADRAASDTARLLQYAQHAITLGLRFTTLAMVVAADPNAWEAVYECHNECRKRQPPVELRTDPIPVDAWRQGFMEGVNARMDGYFLAQEIETGGYVAVCALVPVANTPEALACGFTGTIPAWSGKKVALALKAHAMLWAWEQGFQHVETRTLQINRPIRTINEKLGFTLVKRHRHTFTLPAPLPRNTP